MLKFKNTYNFFISVIASVFLNFIFRCYIALYLFATISCTEEYDSKSIPLVGANNTEAYLPLLKNKRIGIVANQTSVIFKDKTQSTYTHLVDSLLSLNVYVEKIFSPEHGFRGRKDAAEYVSNERDKKTGLKIVSLYGKNKKPTIAQLANLDLIIFDIQDVGVRFFTYISTLHYVLEACAENNIPVIVLDRPNPNGHYIDGPTLKLKHKSFVGMHPVPLVYGMTIGEYAKMINGEKWLKNEVKCNLTVINLKKYTHKTEYDLPIRPSPNLPNSRAINLYPSLGFFEGTPINSGRGTEFQFQRYGSPYFPKTVFHYIPKPNFGSKNPKYKGEKCYGVDLKNTQKQNKVNTYWLMNAYQKYPEKEFFFGKTFTIHVGNTILEKQLKERTSIKEIEYSWKKDIEQFKKKRKKYLLYK